MQNVFHVKIAKVHFFYAETECLTLTSLATGMVCSKKINWPHILHVLLKHCCCCCFWASCNSNESLRESEKSTNLIGDDGKQLTSSCKWKWQLEIEGPRNMFAGHFSLTAKQFQIKVRLLSVLNVKKPPEVITLNATHFQVWTENVFSIFFLLN